MVVFSFRNDYEREVARKLVHLLGSVLYVLLLLFFGKQTAFLLIFSSFLLLFAAEKLELRKIYVPLFHESLVVFSRKKYAKPGKGAVESSLACSVAVIAFPPAVAIASILVFGFGDTFATLVGRPYGGRLLKRVNGKSLEGFLSFVVSGTFAASLVFPLGFSLTLAFAGALTEMFLHDVVDDNMSIPLLVGSVAVFLLA